MRDRLKLVRRLRALLADNADAFTPTVNRPSTETLTAEVLPLAEACCFLERNADRILAPQRFTSYKPLWMRSVHLEARRDPVGVVLVIGPANYPIFLPGVQLIQALVAGNSVIVKPGANGSAAARLLLDLVRSAGFPRDVAVLLDESPNSAVEAIDSGVDKVVITGSKQSGQAVLSQLSTRIIPAVAELSGWDPVFVLKTANLDLVARALRFGVNLNRGNTCIRPRVVFAAPDAVQRLQAELAEFDLELIPVANDNEALTKASMSEYALGATVFGDQAEAQVFAERVRAGVVVINDMIVPTAHPAVAFGGRGASGFGLTRGAEGLLELTTLKTIAVQRSGWRPHLETSQPGDARMFSAFIRALHGRGIVNRICACAALLSAARHRAREM